VDYYRCDYQLCWPKILVRLNDWMGGNHLRTSRPKSVNSACVLFKQRVNANRSILNAQQNKEEEKGPPFSFVRRSVEPLDEPLDFSHLTQTGSSNRNLEMPREVAKIPEGRNVIFHPILHGCAFSCSSIFSQNDEGMR
jgi:hypothetical protein